MMKMSSSIPKSSTHATEIHFAMTELPPTEMHPSAEPITPITPPLRALDCKIFYNCKTLPTLFRPPLRRLLPAGLAPNISCLAFFHQMLTPTRSQKSAISNLVNRNKPDQLSVASSANYTFTNHSVRGDANACNNIYIRTASSGHCCI